jgi:23S rRNA (uracil1939-C5)-methyltransferase
MEETKQLQRDDELALEISGSAFEGKCIAKHEKLVVFVEGAVPGDVVKVKILKSKKNFAEAKVIEVLTPSAHRVQPRCKYFGVCGGCKWQHVEYAAQLEFKQQQVKDAFEHLGGFSDLNILPILGSENIYFYRGKMEYSFAEKQWLTVPPQKSGVDVPASEEEAISSSNDTGSNSPISHLPSPIFLGLHVPQRFDKVLDLDECHLQSEVSNRVLNFTRRFAREKNLTIYDSRTESGILRFLVIRESKHTKEVMVNLVTFNNLPDLMREYSTALKVEVPEVTTIVNTINSKKAQIAFGQAEHAYLGDGVIHEQMGSHQFDVSASSFFQTNVLQAEKLYRVAKEFGEFKPTDVVYDLYSGTGSISIFISDAVKQVIGVESVASAIEDADRNAKENGITNCTFVLGDLKDRLTKDIEWMSSLPKPDVMVIDPPRSGMHPKVVEEILKIEPERIVYVSCNPATQARDVKALCESKYRLVKMQPVDMFPHTYHIENVVLLLKK